jgi:hypothetical protein
MNDRAGVANETGPGGPDPANRDDGRHVDGGFRGSRLVVILDGD